MFKQKIVDAYMETARAFQRCSTAKRLKVGCIIVDPETGAIVSVGYNGTLPGSSNVCEHSVETCNENGEKYYAMKTKEEVLHAEENAIAKLAKGGFPAQNTWMFVTHSPCIKCARMIVASGIDRVFFEEKFTGALGCGIDMLNKNGVRTFHYKRAGANHTVIAHASSWLSIE